MRSGPWIVFLIVLAGWAAYSNSFHSPFIFDDISAIPQNTTIQHGWRLGTAFFPPNKGETVSGRPILNLSFALNYVASGTDAWGYHITNLAIHLLNGLLLLGILRRTFLLPALRLRFGRHAQILAAAIALLWVVHPLQTEAVTYIAQRAESLAAMFYLLVLYAVIRGAQSPRATVWYIGAIVACWLGMGTKETVATAPVMVLLYDRTLLIGSFRQAWQQRWKLYLGLAASWGLLAGLILQRGFVTKTADFHIPGLWWSYAYSQPGVLLYYLRLAFWPHPLCLDWCWPIAKGWIAIGLPMLAVGLLLGATLWSLCRSGHHSGRRAWGLLGAWFFLILAPSSSIVPLVQLVCEHRMYLPLAAVITLLVIGAYLAGQRWLTHGRQVVGLGLAISVAVAFGILTFERNRDYQSEFALWEDTTTKVPNNPRAQINWGDVLFRDGRLQDAMEHFERALQIDPNYVLAHINLGNALLAIGRSSEAIQHYEQAIQLNPGDSEAHYNLGKALLALGQPSAAIQHIEQAVRLKPDYAIMQNELGNAYLALGQLSEAISHYQQALQIDPSYAKARSNWGTALLRLGRWSEAIEQYQQFLQIAPDSPDSPVVHLNLALAMPHVGRLDEAIEHGQEAARRLPDNLQITCLDTLAAAYAAAGRFDEAIATAKAAWQLAQAAGQNSAAEEIHMRLQLYRDRKPY